MSALTSEVQITHGWQGEGAIKQPSVGISEFRGGVDQAIKGGRIFKEELMART